MHPNQFCRNVKATQEPHPFSGHQRLCSRSRSQAESSRRQHRSCSPHTDTLPSHHEGYTRDISWQVKRNKPEVFHSSAGSCGGVCMVCLGRHEHFFAKCEETKLWNDSAATARKNEQGCFTAANGQHLCFNWQLSRSCTSTAHADRHKCLSCRSSDHGAQNCPQAEKV